MNDKILKKPKPTKSSFYYTKLNIATTIAMLAFGGSAIMAQFSAKEDYNSTRGNLTENQEEHYVKSVPIYSQKSKGAKVTTLKSGTVVVLEDFSKHSPENMFKVTAIDETDSITKGYVPSKYIKSTILLGDKKAESQYPTIYKVTAQQGINLRNSAEINDNNKICSIPNGSILIGNTEQKTKDKQWTSVIYVEDKNMHKGYVASEFLQELGNLTDKKVPTTVDKRKDYIVENDNVFGIDVSSISEEKLEKILTGKLTIPKIVETKHLGKVDISKYKNRIPNFVYIKAGSSQYSRENLRKGYRTKYKKLASICEKHKVPYGFYYYSTCVNEKEAQIESQWILDLMKDLGSTNYHVLPFAVDVEVHSEKDRHLKYNIKTITAAKIKLVNSLEASLGKSILYTARGAVDPRFRRILNLEEYQSKIKSGPSHLWYVAPVGNDTHQQSLNKASPVHAKQIALDVKGLEIDINVFGADVYPHYLNDTYKCQSREYAAKKNNHYLAQNEEKMR